MSETIHTDEASPTIKRPLIPAFTRGWSGKCPNCGTGKIFHSYLKVAHNCPHCAEDLNHHRADDAPPYITIVLVGHILVGLMLHLEMAWNVPPMIYVYTLVPLAVILPLLFLPPIKGVIVALQWAHRMHGFDGQSDDSIIEKQAS